MSPSGSKKDNISIALRLEFAIDSEKELVSYKVKFTVLFVTSLPPLRELKIWGDWLGKILKYKSSSTNPPAPSSTFIGNLCASFPS